MRAREERLLSIDHFHSLLILPFPSSQLGTRLGENEEDPSPPHPCLHRVEEQQEEERWQPQRSNWLWPSCGSWPELAAAPVPGPIAPGALHGRKCEQVEQR